MQNPSVTGAMTTRAATISLVDVGRYYEPNRFPYQRHSLDWLQHQTASATLSSFVQRWNNPFGGALPTLRIGDRGQGVAELQRALNRLEYCLEVDGELGGVTQAAVRHFQQQRQLQADGVVGKQTWSELFKGAGTIRLSELLNLKNELTAGQVVALAWLQVQLPRAVVSEFAKRWRNQVQ